ncbi:hypothetical protein VC279_17135 [Xanthomonas sp. WHRI 10064A]|uniref:hypothetical protein n=1 Tax=unclassified Xanthomonas TaxID=2643310 RepID=UPI002B23D270|nr:MULTISPECIES: hypothetical protein [unclassified Xanthomonas]MEA9587172.1 hypothetical protein [Xanthomonas sp. WHRI 10064B]MEA9616363.1 hypothetical protein [Xanthomonas sp. WHRI 10064A]
MPLLINGMRIFLVREFKRTLPSKGCSVTDAAKFTPLFDRAGALAGLLGTHSHGVECMQCTTD